MKRIFLLFLALCFVSLYSDQVDFNSKPMTAGKSSLAENGYLVTRLLDTVNFSPEIRLPIQLIYNSASEKTGMFGYAWKSPQLESSAKYDKDGVLWVTPWGEKIKFYPKKEKLPKDAVKIPLYEEAKKGQGFYAPYSEWEADTSSRDYRRSGEWVFTGKNNKAGWRFTYSGSRPHKITAPSGRTIEYVYVGKKLTALRQNNFDFVTFEYTGNQVSSLTINGVKYELKYLSAKLRILPKTEKGQIISAVRPALASIKRGDLLPSEFSYDDYGFLNKIKQGDHADILAVQHQTLDQRYAELRARKNKKIKYNGPVNGRIISDDQFTYKYGSSMPGTVTLVNRLNRKASYDYNVQTGIFKVSEFSGKSYTIYYFMRHDVAYLGKVRKIVDGRGRDVVNYRYDKLSGNVVRIRNMFGNDINFEYGKNGKVSLITRRAADQDKPEPFRSFQYDRKNNLTGISTLNENGEAVVTTKLTYGVLREIESISNGQTKTEISRNTFGYPVSVTNVFGQTVTRELDRFNRMASSTDFYGVKTYYTYTPAGLIAKIERKDGSLLLNSLEIKYNGNGQPISYTDQSGKTKRFERDAFGRIVKEFFPDNTSVEYSYNKLGQLHTVLDQNKHKITFDWNKFGLDAKTTPAGQLTDYIHDKYGLLAKIDSKWHGKTDRSIKYEYDKYDRIVRADYGSGNIETRKYDSRGKLLESKKNNQTLSFKYDYFGRIVEKTENDVSTFYSYNPWGQCTGRMIRKSGKSTAEFRKYDRFGRLSKIISGGKTIEYTYDSKNRIACQIINGTPVVFLYDKYGHLTGKKMLKNQKNQTERNIK